LVLRQKMPSVQLLFRICKALFVSAIALMALLITFGNISDYYTNYHFVEHVLKMDSVFPDSNVHYRHISSPLLYHAGYVFIICLEAAMAFCCARGGWLLFKNLRSGAAVFHSSKNWAVAGIGIGIAIWFLGFEVIGGEWFSMWQSNTWNGLDAADRVVCVLLLVLVTLHQKDEELSIK
jgi:predicted small integral membrane protein